MIEFQFLCLYLLFTRTYSLSEPQVGVQGTADFSYFFLSPRGCLQQRTLKVSVNKPKNR